MAVAFEGIRAVAKPDRRSRVVRAPELRAVPVTIHIPLSDVPTALTAPLLERTVRILHASLRTDFGLPEPVIFQGSVPKGACLICPPNSLHKEEYKEVENPRSAMLSGWALIPGAKFRYRCDTMFPRSDHADFPGLIEAVNRIRPKRILTVHGFTQEFATELRRLNHDAWSIDGNDQLELALRV